MRRHIHCPVWTRTGTYLTCKMFRLHDVLHFSVDTWPVIVSLLPVSVHCMRFSCIANHNYGGDDNHWQKRPSGAATPENIFPISHRLSPSLGYSFVNRAGPSALQRTQITWSLYLYRPVTGCPSCTNSSAPGSIFVAFQYSQGYG
jgi:hypothetical protein